MRAQPMSRLTRPLMFALALSACASDDGPRMPEQTMLVAGGVCTMLADIILSFRSRARRAGRNPYARRVIMDSGLAGIAR